MNQPSSFPSSEAAACLALGTTAAFRHHLPLRNRGAIPPIAGGLTHPTAYKTLGYYIYHFSPFSAQICALILIQPLRWQPLVTKEAVIPRAQVTAHRVVPSPLVYSKASHSGTQHTRSPNLVTVLQPRWYN